MYELLIIFELCICVGIFLLLSKILNKQNLIMDNQQVFDAKITEANASLDAIQIALEEEKKQIQDFIDANPKVDTSALGSVVGRLATLSDAVSGVFTSPGT